MAITRSAGAITFECDGDGGTCGEVFETGKRDFDAALEKFKMEAVEGDGWIIVKIDGEYEHLCSDCKQL